MLGGRATPEKEMAAHSSTLAWKSPWTEEPGRLYRLCDHGVAKSRTRLSAFTSLHFTFKKEGEKAEECRGLHLDSGVSDCRAHFLP